MLSVLPDPAAVVAAMSRAVADGGLVAFYVWDYAGRMELMRFWDAARTLDPSAAGLDERVRFPLCNPAKLALWRRAGLGSIETTAARRPDGVLGLR